MKYDLISQSASSEKPLALNLIIMSAGRRDSKGFVMSVDSNPTYSLESAAIFHISVDPPFHKLFSRALGHLPDYILSLYSFVIESSLPFDPSLNIFGVI